MSTYLFLPGIQIVPGTKWAWFKQDIKSTKISILEENLNHGPYKIMDFQDFRTHRNLIPEKWLYETIRCVQITENDLRQMYYFHRSLCLPFVYCFCTLFYLITAAVSFLLLLFFLRATKKNVLCYYNKSFTLLLLLIHQLYREPVVSVLQESLASEMKFVFPFYRSQVVKGHQLYF